ncbi:MAG TPA: aspartate/glutamate racemase family protein [Acidobacteriaceae bacterium]
MLEPHSPKPWLHIARVVADEAAQRGYHHIGILDTRSLVVSEIYPEVLAACSHPLPPPQSRRARPHRPSHLRRVSCGIFTADSIAYYQQVIAHMKDQGCDAIVLGCTEIPLIISDLNSPLPTIDSTRLLARAALARAIGDKS